MNINLIWTVEKTIIDGHQSSEKVRTTKTWNENYPHLALLRAREDGGKGEKRSLIVICGLKEPHVDGGEKSEKRFKS